ncbi:MAG: DUF402 domain-containing protein [Dehalococcoidia bacterium]
MPPFEYHYLRRLADGRRLVTVHTGDVVVRRDDAVALVVDCSWTRPGGHIEAHLLSRSGEPVREPVLVAGARLWLWRERPWRMFELFDPAGAHAGYRIDFTSTLARTGGVHHQVDLYLDLFIDPMGGRWLVEDDEELDEAVALGWITTDEAERLRAACRELLGWLEDGEWQARLAGLCGEPFDLAALPAAFSFTDSDGNAPVPPPWIGPE